MVATVVGVPTGKRVMEHIYGNISPHVTHVHFSVFERLNPWYETAINSYKLILYFHVPGQVCYAIIVLD